jgi:O-antigen ligase
VSLERAQLALLAALAATIPVSIFAAEALLALGILVLAARVARGRVRLPATPLDAPLIAYTVWTLLSASFSPSPAHSHEAAKKLLLFALFYLGATTLVRKDDRERVTGGLLAGGIALATMVMLQRHFLGFDEINRRPPGFLGHYMSAAGVTMGTLVLAAARLVHGPLAPLRRGPLLALVVLLTAIGGVAALHGSPASVPATRLFVAALALAAALLALRVPRPDPSTLALVAFPLASLALFASMTRGAWLGAVCGLAVVAAARRPRLLAVLVGAVVLLLLVRPAAVATRLTLGDESSRDRYFMWQAGVDMVLDRPVFGQGPGMVQQLYPRYRWPEAPNPATPHLHNNLMQIAAERGLPGAIFFLWWIVAAVVDATREARRTTSPAEGGLATGVLAVLVAVLVAGLFEYNLGDSEVLMLVLLLTAVPTALRGERAAGGA